MVCHATSNTGHGQQANDRGKWEGEQSWVCFWQLPLTPVLQCRIRCCTECNKCYLAGLS